MTFANYVHNFIQHLTVKVNSICRGNYWGLPVWISSNESATDHMYYILHMLEKKWEYN